MEDLLAKVDQAILSTDWTKLDYLARKCRRRKFISQGNLPHRMFFSSH